MVIVVGPDVKTKHVCRCLGQGVAPLCRYRPLIDGKVNPCITLECTQEGQVCNAETGKCECRFGYRGMRCLAPFKPVLPRYIF